MISLKDLALKIAPVSPRDCGDVVYDRFEKSPDCAVLAVVDADGVPVGLVERNSFLTQLAGQYGRAVYGKRAIAPIMEAAPLLVDAATKVGDFAKFALEDRAGDLLKGFVVVEHGRYLGVGALPDLLKATVRERTITAQRLHELAESLRQSTLEAEQQRRFAEAVIEHIPSLVAVRSGTTGKCVLINKAGAAMLGIEREALVGKTIADVASFELLAQLREGDAMLRNLPPGSQRDLLIELPHHPEPRLLRTAQFTLTMPESDPLILTVADDVTEASRAVTRIEQLAHFDVLTGLPNRALFQERLEEALRLADRSGAGEGALHAALLIIDIDRFKSVNDTFGHSMGDLLLREVAIRLKSVVRPDDLPSRLGGDEFAILITGRDAPRIVTRIADRLNDLLSRPFQLGNNTVHVGGSAGIAIYPEDAGNAEDLIRHADIALYRAKADGKGVWRRFTEGMQADLQQRSELERDLRRALEAGEFEAHFQPILSVEQGRICGFEALMRWHHPERGLIPPSVFVPVAEDIGLIGPLGEWMIRQACQVASMLPGEITVAVNISAVQFRLPGFVSCVIQALAASGLAAHRLEVEVTESVLMQDEVQVLKSVRQLRELGVRIALDDFGTGYASLAYLQRFPFDKIKIDQSFIRGLPGNKASIAIIAAVTALADQLGMCTTAEGVETEEQRETVIRLGCSQLQGYLIGHPTVSPLDFLPATPLDNRAAA